VLAETYTPNKGPWVELQPPTSKRWEFGDRVGSLVHRINPNYLSYWNPDVAGRGFLFGALMYVAACWFLGLGWILVPLLWTTEPPQNVPYLLRIALPVIVTALGPLALVGGLLAARLRLPPPTYFNRRLQQVMCYQKIPGRKGEWLVWDWASITPAIRQAHVYSTAGRSTMYVLVLMQLEKGTNKILRSFGAYSSAATMQPVEAAWEYMRRYMNEPPENVPAAYIPPFEFDPKTWAVRLQIESMQVGMNPDGSFRSVFASLFMPVVGTLVYPAMWATLWIEKTAPKVPLPPEIEAQNRWDDSQPNPYKIEYAYSGPNAEYPVAQVYERIKLRHRVMTVLGFGFYAVLLATMLFYGWAGAQGQ
jgi:hypothetical protein